MVGFQMAKNPRQKDSYGVSDIRLKRIGYLEQLFKYRSEGRPIFYTDESYILTSDLRTGIKDRRLIMVHAGNENGFVPNPPTFPQTWTDFKYHLKRKHSGLREDYQSTGGGPPKTLPLTELEERALALLGTTFYQGINSKEQGCSFMKEKNFDHSTLRNDCSHQTDFGLVKEPPEKRSCLATEIRIPFTEKHNFNTFMKPEAKRFSSSTEKNDIADLEKIDDHTYSSVPSTSNLRRLSRKPQSKNYNSLFKETITYLKSIDETLGRELPLISCSIDGVAAALKEKYKTDT